MEKWKVREMRGVGERKGRGEEVREGGRERGGVGGEKRDEREGVGGEEGGRGEEGVGGEGSERWQKMRREVDKEREKTRECWEGRKRRVHGECKGGGCERKRRGG